MCYESLSRVHGLTAPAALILISPFFFFVPHFCAIGMLKSTKTLGVSGVRNEDFYESLGEEHAESSNLKGTRRSSTRFIVICGQVAQTQLNHADEEITFPTYGNPIANIGKCSSSSASHCGRRHRPSAYHSDLVGGNHLESMIKAVITDDSMIVKLEKVSTTSRYVDISYFTIQTELPVFTLWTSKFSGEGEPGRSTAIRQSPRHTGKRNPGRYS